LIRNIKGKIIEAAQLCLTYDQLIKIRYKIRKSFRTKVDKNTEIFKRNLQSINSVKNNNKNGKPLIVFICQFPAVWNGMDSVYRAAINNDKVEAICLALPEKIMDKEYDIRWEKYGKNESYKMLKNKGYKVIDGQKSEGKWYDLKALHPAYVFLPRPYDIHLPECYRSYTISEYTKVCYIPYGYDNVKWDSKMTYEFDFLNYTYAIFAENKYYYNELFNIYKSVGWDKIKRVFNLGYPRFDFYANYKPSLHKRKTVVWLPRWTTNRSIEATTFFKYKDYLINFFIKHPEYDFICRPHPLMLRNFVSCGLLSQHDESQFLKVFDEYSNFFLDSDGDFLKSFKKADIFISDFTSLLVEELIIDKPIIFTGQTNHFTKFSWKISQGMYLVNNQRELDQTLLAVLHDNDAKENVRKKISMKIYNPANGNIGDNIINALVEDYQNS